MEIPIRVGFNIIKYIIDMLRLNPEHNTIVTGKKYDVNDIFIASLVEDAKVSGFYIYPNCKLFFWRRWSMRKEFIYVIDIERDISFNPNQLFNDYAVSKYEKQIYEKYGYKVIVKTRLRSYSIQDTFKL